jgi:hypothetical protein
LIRSADDAVAGRSAFSHAFLNISAPDQASESHTLYCAPVRTPGAYWSRAALKSLIPLSSSATGTALEWVLTVPSMFFWPSQTEPAVHEVLICLGVYPCWAQPSATLSTVAAFSSTTSPSTFAFFAARHTA